MTFLEQHYGPTEGPLGFPMPDRAAQALDSILSSLPRSSEFAYRKLVSVQPPTELAPVNAATSAGSAARSRTAPTRSSSPAA